jgi:hypothetical protein
MTRTLRHGTGFLILQAILLPVSLSGCTSVGVLMLTGEAFSPKASISDVEVLEQEPTRPHIQIAELSVDSYWLSVASKRRKILEKAATLGADAVVFADPEMPPLPQGNRLLGQMSPTNWSGSRATDLLVRDVVRSAARDEIPHDDVRVVLIRGGGGGHGRGGHWGGMRGRSGPSAARPWGRFYYPYYGPRYWGYGFYGPGSLGYAPFWRGYDPLWGNYPPYPGLGSMFVNTVTVGTAIRYSDSL